MTELIPEAKWWKFDFHNHTSKSNDLAKCDAINMDILAYHTTVKLEKL
jgi:hypothetical protein